MIYTLNLHDVGVDTVKRGVSTPFEQIKTGSYENARKSAIEFTVEDHNCSAVIVNTSTLQQATDCIFKTAKKFK